MAAGAAKHDFAGGLVRRGKAAGVLLVRRVGGGQAFHPNAEIYRLFYRIFCDRYFITIVWSINRPRIRPVRGKSGQEWAKMSSAAQPARSSRTRSGRNRKQAAAKSVRPSRAIIESSFSLSTCR